MKKIKGLIKGGLALCLLLAMLDLAWGYAAMVNVHKANILTGVTEIRLIAGALPNQTSLANLSDGVNFSIDDVNGGDYRIYNVYKSPSAPLYLLLLKGAEQYRILGPITMGTTVPTNAKYTDAVSFYKIGPPALPTIDSIDKGYETAKVNLTYSSNYQYASIDLQVVDNETGTPLQDSKGNGTTSIPNFPAAYMTGALIDGRVLATDADGHSYKVRVRGIASGVAAVDTWGEALFSTIPLGPAQPQTPFNLVLKSNVGNQIPGPGINSFGLPPGPWYLYKDNGTDLLNGGNQVVSGFHLVRAINEVKAKNVSSLGSWDETNQQLVGSMLTYKEDGTLDDASIQSLSDKFASLSQGKGYQIYVKEPVTVVIKATK